MFGLFKKKELIVLAQPFKAFSMFESITLAGIGSGVFITVLPVVSSGLGAWLACTTSGCTIFSTSVGGFCAGSSSTGVSMGIGSYLYYTRYKEWSIREAGKYVVQDGGRLEKVIPLACIVSPTIVVNPLLPIVLVNTYSCVSSFVRTKRLIKSSGLSK